MNLRAVFSSLGGFLLVLGLTMAFPLGVALYYGEGDAGALGLALLATCAAGAAFFWTCRRRDGEPLVLGHREGFLIVTAGWLLAVVFGSLPYLLYGALTAPVDAFFETMSGFTTTGATVVRNIEALPHGILLWRAQTQWLGGMGIIVLSVAILPFLGVGGRQLFRAEMPGPTKDKLKPRIAETARSLWIVYGVITGAGFLLLLPGGMNAFDALCHIFCAMATGGFSTRNASVAHYGSAYIDGVLTVFMLLAGMNFTLHHALLLGNVRAFFRDSELRFYLAVVLVATAAVTLDLRFHVMGDFVQSFRYAVFQVVSIVTTTGFVTDNFARWPALSQVILLLLMFIGGSAGSTGGGMKCIRLLLLIKHGYGELYRLVHPHAVVRVKLGRQVVAPEILGSVWGFFLLYVTLAAAATLAMSGLGLDILTSFSSVATTLGNVGPGLGLVHPETTFADIPSAGKWILSFCMLAGRLEIYTLLVLLVPEFWKK